MRCNFLESFKTVVILNSLSLSYTLTHYTNSSITSMHDCSLVSNSAQTKQTNACSLSIYNTIAVENVTTHTQADDLILDALRMGA